MFLLLAIGAIVLGFATFILLELLMGFDIIAAFDNSDRPVRFQPLFKNNKLIRFPLMALCFVVLYGYFETLFM